MKKMQRQTRTRDRADVAGAGACPRPNGFTLIELMVVLVVMVALSTVAALGFRRNEFGNQQARFIADLEGVLVQARNAAIDRQTQVRIEVEAQEARAMALDAATNTWTLVDRAAMENFNASLITNGNAVCIYGLTAGVQAPAQAQVVAPPTDCLSGTQQLMFEPDGRFTDTNGAFSAVPNAGATLWVADRTLTGSPRYGLIQVFPGGLIRRFERLQ